jgi:hypothetical protein
MGHRLHARTVSGQSERPEASLVEFFIPGKLVKHGVPLHFSQNSLPHQGAGKVAEKLPPGRS